MTGDRDDDRCVRDRQFAIRDYEFHIREVRALVRELLFFEAHRIGSGVGALRDCGAAELEILFLI